MQQSIPSQTPREKEQEMYVERKMKSVWDRKTVQLKQQLHTPALRNKR